MKTIFGIPVINVLWTIVAGKRFYREDYKVQRMMKLLNRLSFCFLILQQISSGFYSLFKGMFQLEYIFPWWGLICYFMPRLNTR